MSDAYSNSDVLVKRQDVDPKNQNYGFESRKHHQPRASVDARNQVFELTEFVSIRCRQK